jgi:hypothetical protein
MTRVSTAAFLAGILSLASHGGTVVVMSSILGIRNWMSMGILVVSLVASLPAIGAFLVLYRDRAELRVSNEWRTAALVLAVAVALFGILLPAIASLQVINAGAGMQILNRTLPLLYAVGLGVFLLAIWRPAPEAVPGPPSQLLTSLALLATVTTGLAALFGIFGLLLGLVNLGRMTRIPGASQQYLLAAVGGVVVVIANLGAIVIIFRGVWRPNDQV